MKTLKSLLFLFICFPLFSYGDIIHVKLDGTGNFTSIQSAILFAGTGDTVLVYPGNYIQIVNFAGKSITVASLFLTTQDTSYISQTVIDGNHENNRLVRFINNETRDAKLIGFTITRAIQPEGGAMMYNPQGLGIYINCSSPTIDNNRIINNFYDDWYFLGGGMAIDSSATLIKNNTISHNTMAFEGGGIYASYSDHLIIENNHIHNNSLFTGYGVSHGAGIQAVYSNYITIRNNIIEENTSNWPSYGMGICLDQCHQSIVENNIISFNGEQGSSAGGGIYSYHSTFKLIGNLISNNNGGSGGGGVFLNLTQCEMTNNTICNNELENNNSGGGICSINSELSIQNSIICFNNGQTIPQQVYLDGTAETSFQYSNIEGGIEDIIIGNAGGGTFNGFYENNIDVNPHFIGTGPHPFLLEINSPCTNTGNPDTTGLFIPEYDLAGNERISQNRIDMGSYEYPFPVNISELNETSKILVYPNPATDKLSIHILEESFQNGWLNLYDMKGNSVLRIQIGNPLDEYDLSFLPRGMYIMNITTEQFVKTEKMVLY